MDDLEQQIRAWADASAPATGEAVRAADVIDDRTALASVAPARPGRRGRLLVAAAAVLVVAVVGGAVVLRGDGGERVRSQRPPATDSTTTTPPVGFVREVAFRQLEVGVTEDGPVPALGSAQSAQQLAELWAAAGISSTAPPDVDFDGQVVVALTIVTDPCLPPLEGMQLEGTTEAATLTPRFGAGADRCSAPRVRATYLVALSWADTGDDFLLTLSGLRPQDGQETLQVTRRGPSATTTAPAEGSDPSDPTDPTSTTEPGLSPADQVTATLELEGDTVAAGASLAGTLTVVNRSGAPIEGTTCGGYFIAYLRNAERQQGIARRACLQGFTIPEGTSTYPVEVRASYDSCAPAGEPSTMPRCRPDGSLPPYPAGRYEVRIDDPQRLVPPVDPVTVAVT